MSNEDSWVLKSAIKSRIDGSDVNKRRHECRERIAKLLMADPVMSNRFIASQAGANGETVGKVRGLLEEAGEIPKVRKRRGIDGRIWCHKEKQLRTNPYWVRRAMEDVQATNVQLLIDVRDLLIHVENRLLLQQSIVGEARNGRYQS